MAVSGSRNFIRTRDQLITRALKEIGALAAGSNPEDFQIPDSVETLNSMVLSWQNEDIYLWGFSNNTQALTDGTEKYTLSSSVLDISDVFIRRDNTDYPVKRINRSQYKELPHKTSASSKKGMPSLVYVDQQLAAIDLYLYEVPENSTDVLHFTEILRFQDFDSSTDNPDFPVKAYEALVWNLALKMCSRYGVTGELKRQITEQAVFEKTLLKYSLSEKSDINIIEPAY